LHGIRNIDAGGDIALHGKAWPVGVETDQGTITLEFAGGGIATSGRDRRRWRRGGGEQHHLIDPSTGRPADGDLLRVTALAESAAEGEVIALCRMTPQAPGRAARFTLSMSSRLVPTLPICGKVKVMICPA
jgi:thiamine biosynthesis lipoprotein ApbE